MSFPSDAARPDAPAGLFEAYYVPARRLKFRNRLWLHLLLFALTLYSTTVVGTLHYLSFLSEFGRSQVIIRPGFLIDPRILVYGFWYSLTLLGILTAHEFGHYLMCRRYQIDASLPYFIPAPIPLTGTLGAVIRIRESFPTRKVLFDVGAAGPIAGFVVLVPALFIGLAMSTVVPAPKGELLWLGEPLLFRGATKLMFGTIAAGQSLNMHPMVFASWFGMLATALNLLPFGQLDGGHITYATLDRYSTPLSLATVGTAVVMTWFSSSWTLLTVMMLVMLVLLGPRHPRVIYELEPLPQSRYVIAILALIILALCFTPVPITPFVS